MTFPATFVGALIVALVIALVIHNFHAADWTDATKPRARKSPPVPPPREDRRCPHPACGAQLVPLSIASNGETSWRCIGCHGEYVEGKGAA